MFTKYVPILRWKSGEKNCLENLSPNVFGNIIPFIEVSPPSDSNNEEAAEKKFLKLTNSFNTRWGNKPFYLYLTEDWYNGIDSTDQVHEIYKNFYLTVNHPQAIPSFDVTDEINISNLSDFTNIDKICLRITVNDFEFLSDILDKYNRNSWIIPQNTDLLIDLKYIDSEIYPKKAALTTVLSDITNISDYRSIIIASCSFPKDVSTLQSNLVNEFTRYEVAVHDIALKLQKAFSFNYVYSDYGPINLNDTPFVIGMVPNFKIKYSSLDKYLVVKGLSLKKGGLDLINVAACCKLLISHPQFSGAAFSYGDKIIADTANGKNAKGGNLTNWVGYSFNHYITLIVSWLQ